MDPEPVPRSGIIIPYPDPEKKLIGKKLVLFSNFRAMNSGLFERVLHVGQ